MEAYLKVDLARTGSTPAYSRPGGPGWVCCRPDPCLEHKYSLGPNIMYSVDIVTKIENNNYKSINSMTTVVGLLAPGSVSLSLDNSH